MTHAGTMHTMTRAHMDDTVSLLGATLVELKKERDALRARRDELDLVAWANAEARREYFRAGVRLLYVDAEIAQTEDALDTLY